jgi:hypothetical protein
MAIIRPKAQGEELFEVVSIRQLTLNELEFRVANDLLMRFPYAEDSAPFWWNTHLLVQVYSPVKDKLFPHLYHFIQDVWEAYVLLNKFEIEPTSPVLTMLDQYNRADRHADLVFRTRVFGMYDHEIEVRPCLN